MPQSELDKRIEKLKAIKDQLKAKEAAERAKFKTDEEYQAHLKAKREYKIAYLLDMMEEPDREFVEAYLDDPKAVNFRDYMTKHKKYDKWGFLKREDNE